MKRSELCAHTEINYCQSYVAALAGAKGRRREKEGAQRERQGGIDFRRNRSLHLYLSTVCSFTIGRSGKLWSHFNVLYWFDHFRGKIVVIEYGGIAQLFGQLLR